MTTPVTAAGTTLGLATGPFSQNGPVQALGMGTNSSPAPLTASPAAAASDNALLVAAASPSPVMAAATASGPAAPGLAGPAAAVPQGLGARAVRSQSPSGRRLSLGWRTWRIRI